MRELCNASIKAKRIKLNAGQWSSRSFVDYDHACRVRLDEFGPTRSVIDLRPQDFEKLNSRLSRKYGITTLVREITVVRMIFKYALESDLIKRPVKFGPTFCGPSKRDLRKAKSKAQQTNGKKLFTAEEIRRLLDAVSPQLKAMILLGINGGIGNSDCALLAFAYPDLDVGWLDFARVKTGVERRIPLWPETVTVLREVIANRRKPADEADVGLVFLTKFGLRRVRYGFDETKRLGKTIIKARTDNQIAKTFGKLIDDLGLKRPASVFMPSDTPLKPWEVMPKTKSPWMH